MPKKHDITIAGETYLNTGTLQMKGANSEEGKTINYVAADPATITNTLGVVAGVSVSETNMELKSLQATKPSGPYIKIMGEASGSGKATISEGYVSTDTTIPNSKTATASVFYPVQAGNTSITGGALSGGGSVTPTVTLSNGNDSNMDNVTAGSKNAIINNYPYYFKVSGSSSATSSTVSRAAVQEKRSEGYIYDKAATNVINADSKVVNVNAGNGSTYVGLKGARLDVSGTASASTTVEPGAISISNKSSTVSGKTPITVKPTTNTSNISKYYVAVDATAAANTQGATSKISGSADISVTTPGYASSDMAQEGTVTGTATAKTSAKTSSTYYLPIATGGVTTTGGALSAGNGAVKATGQGIALGTKTSNRPTSGNYIIVEGSGRVNRAEIKNAYSAGYISDQTATKVIDSTSADSKTETAYYPISSSIVDTSAGDATSEQILKNKIAYVDGAMVKGTMPNNGTKIINLTATNTTYDIPKGYHTGEGEVKISVQEKSTTSSNARQEITPDSGKVLSKVTIAAMPSVNGAIGGSASGGSAKAAINNVNSMNTVASPTGTAGTDYFTVTAKATGTAGGYTPEYKVTTAGYLGSTVSGTKQTVPVSSDSTGVSIHIPKATFTTSGASVKTTSTGGGYIKNNTTVGTIPSGAVTASGSATANATVTPGSVTVADNSASISGKTRIAVSPTTSTSISTPYYIAVKPSVAAGSASISGSGTATAKGSTAGYITTSTTGSGSISVSGTATSEQKDGSVHYLPLAGASFTISGASVKTTSTGAGYVPANTTVGTISSTSRSAGEGSLTLTPGDGHASATGTNFGILGTPTTSQPATGTSYIKVTGSGTVSGSGSGSVSTGTGYITEGSTSSNVKNGQVDSKTQTLYYPIATKNSNNLSVNGATVTTAAGYYPLNASKTIPSGQAWVNDTAITAQPILSNVYTSGQGYKMSVNKTQNIAPSINKGYIETGTSGTITIAGEAYVPQAYLSGASSASTATADRNLNAGQEVSIGAGYYDKTRIIRANSLASQTSGTAIKTDILPNKTAWVNGEKVTGSMPTLDAQTITPGKNTQYLYSGRYLSGTQTIKGDINLEAKNIKEGITIFGITGTYTATPSYKIKGTWRMDANKFASYWPSTDSVFEQSLAFKVKQTYSETNIGYIPYNKMSFGYVTGDALKTITYDSTLAYASSTYGGVTTYPGWQGENFMPGDPAQIIIDTEQEVSETFYNWLTNVATQSGSDEEITVSVGTLTIDASRGGTVYATIFNGSTVTNGSYTIAENGRKTIENVVLNTPFIVVLPALSSNYYYRSTSNVTELTWLSPSDHYTSTSFSGLLASTTGSVNFREDCCFDGGSKVLLPNGATEALVDINIGDTVMSYNETTGTIEENKVTALGTVQLRSATEITLADDTVIRMNIYHPLYTQDGWKSITRYNGLPELTIEDKLLNSEGEYIGIKSIENVVIEEETYYTLKVEGNNNFYVNGILAQGKDKD